MMSSLRPIGRSLALVAAASLAAAGCESSADALFSSGGTPASSGTGAGGGGTGGGASSVAVVSTSQGAGGGTSSSSAATTASTTSGMTTSSVGAGGGGLAVGCGNTTCTVGPQSACCWDEYEVNSGPQGECVSGDPSNDGCFTNSNSGFESYIQCQRPEHCGLNEVCCARRVFVQTGQGQAAYYESLSCTSDPCNWPDIVMCDPSVANDAQCPIVDAGNGDMVQTVCEQSQLLPPDYFVCGAP